MADINTARDCPDEVLDKLIAENKRLRDLLRQIKEITDRKQLPITAQINEIAASAQSKK